MDDFVGDVKDQIKGLQGWIIFFEKDGQDGEKNQMQIYTLYVGVRGLKMYTYGFNIFCELDSIFFVGQVVVGWGFGVVKEEVGQEEIDKLF